MLVGRKKLYIKKGVKLIKGFRNTALYDLNNRKIYLVTKKVGEILGEIGEARTSKLTYTLVDALLKYNLITLDFEEADDNPAEFEYELFDDAYSDKNCKLLYIEVTDKCNFNCIHCYADIKRSGKKFLTVNQVEQIIEMVDKTVGCDIRITGGEPFCNKDICRLLDAVCQKILPIDKHSIVTNGTFDIEDALYALSLGFELQISIYGMTAKTFEIFTKTNQSLFQKVISNICELSKSPYKGRILLCFAVNAYTYDEIDDFIKFAEKLGLRYIFNRPASIGRAVENWGELELSLNRHYEFARSTKNNITKYCYHLCQLHLTVVDVDGNVIPCCFLRKPKFYMGNINEDCLQDIWKSEKYNDFRKLTALNVEKCSNCEFMYACTAGCCGEAEGRDGDILASYPWCKIKPFEKEYLHIDNHELYVAEKLAAGTFDFIKLL